jgi:hypothetical protein
VYFPLVGVFCFPPPPSSSLSSWTFIKIKSSRYVMKHWEEFFNGFSPQREKNARLQKIVVAPMLDLALFAPKGKLAPRRELAPTLV